MPTELTWLGHGTWTIRTAGHALLLDPFLEDNPACPLSPDEVDAQFILVSHGHSDHIADAVSIARRTGAMVISNFEICQWCSSQGIENTHAMNLGGGFSFPFGRVKMTNALHSSMLPDGSNGGDPCGFVLSLPEGNVYFACDTGLFGDMEAIGRMDLKLAALPIGDNFTMGPDDALEAVKLLRPERVVPVHHNTWELIAQDVAGWAQRVRDQTQAEPVVLKPGEKLVL